MDLKQQREKKMQDQKRVTIHDVSRHAGVSIATVSRVLSNYEAVSDETRELVLSAVKELKYQVNRTASNLRKGTNTKIGLLITDIQNPFFGSLTRGIEKITTNLDYTLLLANSDENPEQEQKLIAQLLAEEIAGLIIVPTSDDCQSYEDLKSSGVPFVIVDRLIKNCQHVDYVKVDNYNGAKEATDYLLRLGHKDIAYIGGLPYLSVMQERLQGYHDAITQAGYAIDENLIKTGDNRQHGGYQSMMGLLSAKKVPSAVLIANNLMTLGGLQAIHEMDMQIPGQISLIGFDDMDWAACLQPPLSVVAQPAFEIGELAAKTLINRISTPDIAVQQTILSTKLVLRASCQNAD